MESPLRVVARFVLAGLHRCQPSQSAFRQGQGALLAASYTNLVRWIIELHRVLPEQWVTLQQVYQCAIDPDLFAAKIKQAEAWSAELNTGEVFIPVETWTKRGVEVGEWL